jgi:hypothetical protein
VESSSQTHEVTPLRKIAELKRAPALVRALIQSSSALRPAAVILMRPAPIALTSVATLARSIVASPACTRLASVRRLKPCWVSAIVSVAPKGMPASN